MTRALLEQALEALECAYSENYDGAKIHGAKVAIRADLAQPAWHDAPTVPGVWICDEGDICYTWTAHNIEILDQFDPGDGLRWYGPIPEDRQ